MINIRRLGDIDLLRVASGVEFLRRDGVPVLCPWGRASRADAAMHDRECGSWCPFFVRHKGRVSICGGVFSVVAVKDESGK